MRKPAAIPDFIGVRLTARIMRFSIEAQRFPWKAAHKQ
jgi:hypothetical protein